MLKAAYWQRVNAEILIELAFQDDQATLDSLANAWKAYVGIEEEWGLQ